MSKNPTILIAIVGVCAIASGWLTIIHIDWLMAIQQIIKDAGGFGAVIFVMTYAIATLLILPVTAFNIAGGAIYGGIEGLLLTSLGALLSALLGFVLARSLGTKFNINSDINKDRWSDVSKNLVAGGIGYSFAARLFPLIPYGVVSFAAGLSPIKRRDYLLGTLFGTPLGIAPFVFFGSTGIQMSSSHDVLPLLASSLVLAMLIVAGTWYQQSQNKIQAIMQEPIQSGLRDKIDRKPNHYEPRWDLYLVLGAVGILAIALLLHFWQLSHIPYPVFDEVLFGAYAEEYLDGKPTWEGHPPLGKFFIMLGILLFGRNAIGYRFLSASFGSIMPLLVIGLVYRLTYKRNFALLSGLFLTCDGLFLVESRLGLLNIFLVATGITSQIFLVAGLENKGKLRTFLLCCAGLMLGASVSVKWNGLGFSLLLFLLIMLVWAIAKFFPNHLGKLGILAEIRTLHWWQYLLCFGICPIAFYLVQWLPLFMLDPGGIPPETGLGAIHSFWLSLVRVHEHIFWWHNTEGMMNNPDHPSHPYCSTVWSWPVSARLLGYYFVDSDGYFTVMQGLGNPVLWWLSTLAIVILSIGSLLPRFRKQLNTGTTNYLLLGHFANYVPWLLVKRCLFIYHYMSSAVFSFVALAWLVCQMIERRGIARYLGYFVIFIVVLTQLFFLPIWIGLPIKHSAFYERIWFMPDTFPGFNWI